MDMIKLNPMPSINPDKHVQPTSQSVFYNASDTMDAMYSPKGALLESMHTERIKT